MVFVLLYMTFFFASCRLGGDFSSADAEPAFHDSGLEKLFTDFASGPDNIHHLALIAQIVTPSFRWNFAYGNSSLAPAASATPSMKFRIASVSKTFTAAAICLLVQEGRLSFDDTIDKWAPAEFAGKIPNATRMTIRQILQHRSGMDDYDEMGVMIPKALSQPDVPVSPEFSINEGLKGSPKADPGVEYRYSNPGYVLLSRVIDKASGVGYENFLQTRIFEPLGLKNTSIPKERSINGPHMRCLMDSNKDGSLEDYTDYYLDWDRGAGDLVGTCEDLNTFHQTLRSGGFFTPPVRSEFFGFLETVNTDLSVQSYSLGYLQTVLKPSGIHIFGHSGGYPGSITIMYYIQEANAFVSLNTNIWDLSLSSLVKDVADYLIKKSQ